jgi:trigger factor
MNITRENIDELNAIIKLKVEKTDYADNVEKMLKDYRKKATIKGFRPGNVPVSVIKKMYGKSILIEEVNKIVSENLTKYLIDEKLNILGEPLPSINAKSDIDLDNKDEFEFAFDIAFASEFELKLSKRDKLPYYKINPSEDMIQQTIDNYTGRYGTNEEVDTVQEKDLVKGKFEQLDEQGNVVENGVVADDSLFAVDKIGEESIRALVLNAKKDDIIDFDIKKAFTNVADLSAMLHIDKSIAENLEGNFRFTIKSISRHIPAEINQELFDKIYEKDSVKSEKEFKEKIIEEIKNNFIPSSDYKLLLDAKDKITDKVKLTLPDAFLKRWLLATNKELTEELIEKDYSAMQKDLTWQLVKNKIAEEQDIKIEEQDILDASKKTVLMQFQQYGLMDFPEDQLEAYAKQMIENKEEKQKIIDRLFEEKIIAFIKETVKLDEKQVTYDEFNDLFKK